MKTKTNGSPAYSEHGFTCVELTAMIITVAFLGALVLPALAKGHAGSRTAICLNNHRQLARSCLLYSQDVNGRLPNNYTLPATETAISTGAFDNWVNNIMTWGASASLDDVSNTNVAWAQKGPLSPYLHSNISFFKWSVGYLSWRCSTTEALEHALAKCFDERFFRISRYESEFAFGPELGRKRRLSAIFENNGRSHSSNDVADD